MGLIGSRHSFFEAILSVHNGDFSAAARNKIRTNLTASSTVHFVDGLPKDTDADAGPVQPFFPLLDMFKKNRLNLRTLM